MPSQHKESCFAGHSECGEQKKSALSADFWNFICWVLLSSLCGQIGVGNTGLNKSISLLWASEALSTYARTFSEFPHLWTPSSWSSQWTGGSGKALAGQKGSFRSLSSVQRRVCGVSVHTFLWLEAAWRVMTSLPTVPLILSIEKPLRGHCGLSSSQRWPREGRRCSVYVWCLFACLAASGVRVARGALVGARGMWALHLAHRIFSCDMGSGSSNRDRTRVPCIGSVESYPLDHKGHPRHDYTVFWMTVD